MRTILFSLAFIGMLLFGTAQATSVRYLDIQGSVANGQGTITVVFPTAATDVDIKVYGTKGVVVTSDGQPVADRDVKAGQSITLKVSYTAPPSGTCHLAVTVKATVFGRRVTQSEGFLVRKDTTNRTGVPRLKGTLTLR